jgi:Mn2+/Fe2+ NRAMP family transporter
MTPPTASPLQTSAPSAVPAPPVPKSFFEYLRSFGPGFVAVLTWLGAGDIVSAGVAGGNYGYTLMWAMVLSLGVRYMFVSLIARYQLCNPRGEGVLDALARLHPLYAPFLFFAVLFWGHLSTTYMLAGIGEISVEISGVGTKFAWEVFWVVVTLLLIFRPVYQRAETLFKVLLALLAISLLGCALWVGIKPFAIVRGVFMLEIPPQQGPFGASLVALGMVGAVGGSLVNLVYPYFLEQKGWRGPAYRRVQNYDFLLAVVVMIVFNLAVWTLGAELVHGTGRTISSIDDLAGLLGGVLGNSGRILFLLGVFAAVFTSIVGAGLGLAYLASHAWLRWRSHNSEPLRVDYRSASVYRFVVLWIVVSPLVWLGRVEFISLTILANTVTVVMIPALAGGLWCITARASFIGPAYRNRWWDNALMAFVTVLALFGVVEAVRSILTQLHFI